MVQRTAAFLFSILLTSHYQLFTMETNPTEAQATVLFNVLRRKPAKNGKSRGKLCLMLKNASFAAATELFAKLSQTTPNGDTYTHNEAQNESFWLVCADEYEATK